MTIDNSLMISGCFYSSVLLIVYIYMFHSTRIASRALFLDTIRITLILHFGFGNVTGRYAVVV